jgi:hypothetical protein
VPFPSGRRYPFSLLLSNSGAILMFQSERRSWIPGLGLAILLVEHNNIFRRLVSFGTGNSKLSTIMKVAQIHHSILEQLKEIIARK